MRSASVILMLLLAVPALAVGPEASVDYPGGLLGRVVFSGRSHAVAGLACADCHPKIFRQGKRQFKMTARDHIKGLQCAVCHDGKRAFSADDERKCERCHQKGG